MARLRFRLHIRNLARTRLESLYRNGYSLPIDWFEMCPACWPDTWLQRAAASSPPAVVRVTDTSGLCCLRRRGAACSGSTAPAVSTSGGSQAFSRAKVSGRLWQWPGTCPLCILHGSIRVGPGQIAFSPSRSLRSVRLPFLVPRGRDRASQRRHGKLHPRSIHAHSSNRGSAVLAPH